MKKNVNQINDLNGFSILLKEGHLNVPTIISKIEQRKVLYPNPGIVIKSLGSTQCVSWPFYKTISKIL